MKSKKLYGYLDTDRVYELSKGNFLKMGKAFKKEPRSELTSIVEEGVPCVKLFELDDLLKNINYLRNEVIEKDGSGGIVVEFDIPLEILQYVPKAYTIRMPDVLNGKLYFNSSIDYLFINDLINPLGMCYDGHFVVDHDCKMKSSQIAEKLKVQNKLSSAASQPGNKE